MFKNFFSKNTKQSNREEFQQFPTFEELAPRTFKKLEGEIWKLELETIHENIQKYENYIENIKSSYNEVQELFKPYIVKYDILEKERKRMQGEIDEKNEYQLTLENSIMDMQSELENEQRNRELATNQLEQLKKENNFLKQQIKWNNKYHNEKNKPVKKDEDDSLGNELDAIEDLNEAQMEESEQSENDKLEQQGSEFEQVYTQRIKALTDELQSQLETNKTQINKNQQLQLEIQLQQRKNRELDSFNKSFLQQIVDIQQRSRYDQDISKKLNNDQLVEISKLRSELNVEKTKQQEAVQKFIEFTEMEDRVKDLEQICNGLRMEKDQLQTALKETNSQIINQNKQIQQMQQKRELAITEIKSLSSRLSTNSEQTSSIQTFTVDEVKQINNELQHALIQKRKSFEAFYKQFMIQVCFIQEKYGNDASANLLKLEKEISSMFIGMQELIDDIDDIMNGYCQ